MMISDRLQTTFLSKMTSLELFPYKFDHLNIIKSFKYFFFTFM